MNPTRKWFLITVFAAFVAAILLFNTNSYFADKHKINNVYLVVGILFTLGAVYSLIKTIRYGSTPKS